MYVAIQAVLSLYSSGRTTGIVMDRFFLGGFSFGHRSNFCMRGMCELGKPAFSI